MLKMSKSAKPLIHKGKNKKQNKNPFLLKSLKKKPEKRKEKGQMWIETEKGNLANMERMQTIGIGSDNRSVEGSTGKEKILLFSFTNTKEANETIKKIKKALENSRKLLKIKN